MPLKNNNPPPHPPYSDPGNWRKQYLAETRLSHLFSPLLGECPLSLVYLQYPFVFLCFTIPNLPILVVANLFQTFCCSHFILPMDIIHLLVPSVAAVYERHMETYVNLPPYHPNPKILLCPLSYKDQLRKASCRTTPLPLRPENWRNPLAENKISHLFFPFWGECSLCFVYLHPIPYTLSFCVSLLLPFPFSLSLLPTFCCSILLQWIPSI